MKEITMEYSDNEKLAKSFFEKIAPKIEEIRKEAKDYGIDAYINVSVAADGYLHVNFDMNGVSMELYRMSVGGKYTIRTERSIEIPDGASGQEGIA